MVTRQPGITPKYGLCTYILGLTDHTHVYGASDMLSSMDFWSLVKYCRHVQAVNHLIQGGLLPYYEPFLLLLGVLLVVLGSFWTRSYIHSTTHVEQHDIPLSKIASKHCLGIHCNGNGHISGPLSS